MRAVAGMIGRGARFLDGIWKASGSVVRCRYTATTGVKRMQAASCNDRRDLAADRTCRSVPAGNVASQAVCATQSKASPPLAMTGPDGRRMRCALARFEGDREHGTGADVGQHLVRNPDDLGARRHRAGPARAAPGLPESARAPGRGHRRARLTSGVMVRLALSRSTMATKPGTPLSSARVETSAVPTRRRRSMRGALNRTKAQAAAAANAPPASQRQNVRLSHSPGVEAGLRRGRAGQVQRGADPLPDVVRDRNGGDLGQQRHEARFPGGDLAGEAGVAGDARFRFAPFAGIENTEHVLGGHVARGRCGLAVGRVHRSRQALSLSRLRRIQLFTVPSGLPLRSASSS